jgi:hypothetical protein
MELQILFIYVLIVLQKLYSKLMIKNVNKNMIIQEFSIYAVTGMFLLSSFDKLLLPIITGEVIGGKDTTRLIARYPSVSKKLLMLIVIIGGIVELYSSYLILSGHDTKNKKQRNLGLYILIVFTILATLFMYANPIVGYKYLPIVSNISTIGGLLSLTQF